MKLSEDLRRSVLQAAIQGELTGGSQEGWQRVRLGDIISLLSGHDLPKGYDTNEENGTPYITGASNFKDGEIIINRWTSKPESIAHKGDVLLTCKGTVGKVAILELEKAHIARQIMAITPLHDDINYIAYVMKSNTRNLQQRAKSFIPGIERKDVLNMIIPLPPLEEQHRIVSRLDSILPLIDELEALENELEALKKKFPGDMRDSLLQAAIEGNLTGSSQEGWRWVRLGDIITKDIGGGTPDKSIAEYWNGNIPWMSVKDFARARDGFIEDTIDHISEKGLEHSATNLIMPGAIIICMRMGLGKYARLKKPTAINQDLRAMWLSEDVLADYFLYFYSTLKIEGTGTTVKGIKRNELLSYLIPLPPLDEQHRIVSRLNELLPLCEALEHIE